MATSTPSFEANTGKQIHIDVDGVRYARLPVKTRLISEADELVALLDEYAKPHLLPGDILLISEKIVCITQGRMMRIDSIKPSFLARLLSRQVRNHVGTPQFRGYGHGTAPAMHLLIEEAGVPRVLLATLASALTRPLGIKGAFYYVCGKRAKSIDCPMSFTLAPYTEYAKQAPHRPHELARDLAARYGVDVVIIDANYRGAFSLGKSRRTMRERFIRDLVRDNPAGQDSEMTPFLIVRDLRGS